MKKGVLRVQGGGHLGFWCPGCECFHSVNTDPTNGGPCWGFNGDFDRPTFTPSVLCKSGHYAKTYDQQRHGTCWCDWERIHGEKSPFRCEVCHSFVRDGHIEYLGDCTHALAGKTVPMVDAPESYDD